MKLDVSDLSVVFHDFFVKHLSLFAGNIPEKMRQKSDGSSVGETDEAIQSLLLRLIRERFPFPAISEEQECIWPPPHDRFWILDPRDGSNNKRMGFYPLVGSMASLVDGGVPVFSAIFVPAEEELAQNGFYFAGKGYGAWRWNWSTRCIHKIQVSTIDKLSEGQLLIEGPSRKVAEDNSIRGIQKKMPWRINLTCAWAFTRLSSGLTDIVITVHNKPTDTIHGILFTQESGGVVTDWEGRPATLENCRSLVYSNGLLHNAALKALRGGVE